MPLQEDELAALNNAQQQQQQQQQAVTKQKVMVVASSAPVSTLRTVLTTGLRPQQQPQQVVLQPVQTMQPPTVKLLTPTVVPVSSVQSSPATIIPDHDPSLDENLLSILAADCADNDEDDPMMSPSSKPLSGLNNAALVLPNTVFSSKPMSSQDVGVFLQSSGKSNGAQPGRVGLDQKPVILTSSSAASQFVLPRSTASTVSLRNGSHSQLSHSATTSSQTLRSLLSSTPENLPVSQTMILTPLNNKSLNSAITSSSNLSSKLVNPSPLTSAPKLSSSFPSDSVSLTLDDIISLSPDVVRPAQPSGSGHGSVSLSGPSSDRESDLTSPASVRSEMTDNGKSEEGDSLAPDKLHCPYPGCTRTFDRPNLLKRHQKIHSGECR